MKKILSFFFIGVLLITLFSAILYAQSKAHHGPVTIGFVAELSGPFSTVGNSSKNAAVLAINEINQHGGITIHGEKHIVNLIIADNKSSVSQTNQDIEKLINKNVIAVIGPNASLFAITAADTAERNKMVLISPWSTDPKTTFNSETDQPKQYVYRTAFTDALQAKILAKFARVTLHAKSAAILYDNKSDTLANQAIYFRNSFQNTGGNILNFESTENTSDSLENIQKENPDLVFLPTDYKTAATIILKAHTLGITAPFLGTTAWENHELLTLCGSDCEGYYFGSHFSPDAPDAKDFVLNYITQYNEKPDEVAALTYDSFGLLFHALQNASDIDTDATKNSLSEMMNFQGVTGNISFANGHDPIKSVEIIKITNGAFQWYENINL